MPFHLNATIDEREEQGWDCLLIGDHEDQFRGCDRGVHGDRTSAMPVPACTQAKEVIELSSNAICEPGDLGMGLPPGDPDRDLSLRIHLLCTRVEDFLPTPMNDACGTRVEGQRIRVRSIEEHAH